MRLLSAIALLFSFALPAPAQELQYTTGRVAPTPQALSAMKAELKSGITAEAEFPDCKLAEYDARKFGLIGPIKNQGDCGSCWLHAGVFCQETAYAKAGIGKADDYVFSEQYFLSCVSGHGGCNGDDDTTLLKYAKRTGVPLTKDYGPYHARRLDCNFTDSMKRFKVDDWGFADGDAGYEQVADTQKIKNAIYACGGVGVAIAADGRLGQLRPGQVFRGNYRQINHEVGIVGWKPDTERPGKTVWIVRNSWGTNWGDGGYGLVAEGANMVGTQPVWATVKNPNPPPPDPKPLVVGGSVLPMLGLLLVVAVAGVLGYFFGRHLAKTPAAPAPQSESK